MVLEKNSNLKSLKYLQYCLQVHMAINNHENGEEDTFFPSDVWESLLLKLGNRWLRNILALTPPFAVGMTEHPLSV